MVYDPIRGFTNILQNNNIISYLSFAFSSKAWETIKLLIYDALYNFLAPV